MAPPTSTPSSPRSNAFVTLLTSPSYLPGALVLAHSLLALHPPKSERKENEDFETICLVTPETVDVGSIKELRKVYDVVVGVEVIDSGLSGAEGLRLMDRPDLSQALTKLHIFRLHSLSYTNLIYLDADVLPLRSLSHLFLLPNRFSACPDTGWPDCFNSGVMVFQPSEEDFEGLRGLLTASNEVTDSVDGSGVGKISSGNGSFDGADQGVLNEWFSEEGGGGDWNRLSFTYNVTPSAAYTYAPAYKRYGPKIHAVHFIGPSKPWKSIVTRPARAPVPTGGKAGEAFDYPSLVDRWFAVYDKHMRPMGAEVPAPTFAVPDTVAAWNEPALASHKGRMDLEDLKNAASKGVGYFMSGGSSKALEGRYISLPLDGRIDLMRPQPVRPASPPKEAAPSISASPPAYAQPLPSTPSQPQQQGSNSPPVVHWDAGTSSPPKDSGPEMKDGMNEFYENAWDLPLGRQQSAEWNPTIGYPTIPDSVRNDQWYAGAADIAPDRKSVKPIFPWEQSRTVAPSRVFPPGDTPVSGSQSPVDNDSQSAPPPPPPAQTQQPPPPPPAPPKSFSESIAGYRNAWDDIPEIKQYVERMSGNQRPPIRSLHSQMPSVSGSGSTTPTRENPLGLSKEKARKGRAGSNESERRSDASHDGDDEGASCESDTEESPPPPGIRKDRKQSIEGGFDFGAGRPGGGAKMSSGAGRRESQDQQSGGSRRASATTLERAVGTMTPPTPRPIFKSAVPKVSPTTHERTRSSTDSSATAGESKVRRIDRMSSNDTTYSGSGTSTSALTPPTEDTPLPPRPAGRVFDPSTSIDARKKDTVEVLSRFMRAAATSPPTSDAPK